MSSDVDIVKSESQASGVGTGPVEEKGGGIGLEKAGG